MQFYKIGNILENNIEDILNSNNAKLFLEQFKTQDFKYCNLNICPMAKKIHDEEFEKLFNEYNIKNERTLRLNYDQHCNVNCICCRPLNFSISKEQIQQYDEMNKVIEKILPYANKNHWIISLNGVGEVFANKNSLKLIKNVVKNYPNIFFGIITNGTLCSEEIFNKLNITDKISNIEISIHAFKEETYNKIVLNGNFKNVQKNLKYVSKLHNEGKIKTFYMNFVITSYNYREMEDFIHYAWSLGATPNFLPLIHIPGINADLFNELNIVNKKHPQYKDFTNMIKNPIFHSEKIIIPVNFLDL